MSRMSVTTLQARKLFIERRAPKGGTDGDHVFDMYWVCSNCEARFEPVVRIKNFMHPKNFNYCPNCGAHFSEIPNA